MKRAGVPARNGSSPQAWGTQSPGQLAAGARRVIPTGVGNSRQPRCDPSGTPGHPHRRGELSSRNSATRACAGSSPQAWGTLKFCLTKEALERVIPTGVGNSSQCTRRPCGTAGHPHRRGELRYQFAAGYTSDGSSPQAWGTRPTHRGAGGSHRVIPTGVGNSGSGAFEHEVAAGHPHRRGELRQPTRMTCRSYGSSPQAWGTPDYCRYYALWRRVIPTGVGNSCTRSNPARSATGHPHRRGELCSKSLMVRPRAGSSPQAWGTRVCSRWRARPRRVIPTGVGNSPIGYPRSCGGTGHPHRRGELRFRVRRGIPVAGSSPQAWGTRFGAECSFWTSRVIPTGVGNSRALRTPWACRAGHPHRRGELSEQNPQDITPTGSSPQAWGTRTQRRASIRHRGSSPQAWGTPQAERKGRPELRVIPTGVGNSPSSGLRPSWRFGSSPQAWGTRFS